MFFTLERSFLMRLASKRIGVTNFHARFRFLNMFSLYGLGNKMGCSWSIVTPVKSRI